ncbi:MAG: hypothetical protein ACXW61_00035 [Gemmatirosa sp.]
MTWPRRRLGLTVDIVGHHPAMLLANPDAVCTLPEATRFPPSAPDAARDACDGCDGCIAVPAWWIRHALRDAGQLPDDGERFVANVMAAIRQEVHAPSRAPADAT